jgi:hypothetical protein
MDKTIYIFLAIVVVLYGLYRLNSNEHFSDNTTVYIKTQQMRQYELGKEQLLKAQQKEIEIKRKMLEAQIEEEKVRNQEIEEKLMKRKEETDEYLRNKNKLIDEKLEEEITRKEEELTRKIDEINKLEEKYRLEERYRLIEEKKLQQAKIDEHNKLETRKKEEKDETEKKLDEQKREEIEKRNQFINKITEIKPYIERFNQIKEKIYEFMGPSVSSISIFNTAKTCGFSYDLVNETSTLSQGQMYMNSDKSQLTIHYADKTGNTGINIPLSGTTLFMRDGVSRYQIAISDFNSDSKGIFKVTTRVSGIPDKFFNGSITYILNECEDERSNNIIMENQLWNSLLIFIGLVIFALLIINYKTVIELYSYYFSNKPDFANKIEGGNHIFYVGGYDYRDYSD